MCRRCLTPSPTGSGFACCPSVSRGAAVLVVALVRRWAGSSPSPIRGGLGDFTTGWLKRLSAREREILLAVRQAPDSARWYAVPLGVRCSQCGSC